MLARNVAAVFVSASCKTQSPQSKLWHPPAHLHLVKLQLKTPTAMDNASLDEAFDAATQYVGAASTSGSLSNEQLLQFYG